MTYYYDSRFLKYINKNDIKIIIEAGARYGDETIKLSEIFTFSKIYSFECNPKTVNICKNKLLNRNNVFFYDYGLGDKDEFLPFYSYLQNNDGASSFLKRIDYNNTQEETGIIKIIKLVDFVKKNNIEFIDLLCMDVQGYELNILKGCEGFIKNIKFLIMEEPKKVIPNNLLPENIHSSYINAPTSKEISEFMKLNNFIEIERLDENMIEDNVMYKNLLFTD